MGHGEKVTREAFEPKEEGRGLGAEAVSEETAAQKVPKLTKGNKPQAKMLQAPS